MQKNYKIWSVTKASLNNFGKPPLDFHAGEIWYCSIGENIGIEQDGRADFVRPVVIIKKCSNRQIIGIPLTSRPKVNKTYLFDIGIINNRNSIAIFSQIRTWDAVRLRRRMGKMRRDDFKKLLMALADYLFNSKHKSPSSEGDLDTLS